MDALIAADFAYTSGGSLLPFGQNSRLMLNEQSAG